MKRTNFIVVGLLLIVSIGAFVISYQSLNSGEVKGETAQIEQKPEPESDQEPEEESALKFNDVLADVEKIGSELIKEN